MKSEPDGIFTATTLINFSMNWEDKTEVKAGNIGERYKCHTNGLFINR